MKVRLTIAPDLELEVSETSYLNLKGQGLLLNSEQEENKETVTGTEGTPVTEKGKVTNNGN